MVKLIDFCPSCSPGTANCNRLLLSDTVKKHPRWWRYFALLSTQVQRFDVKSVTTACCASSPPPPSSYSSFCTFICRYNQKNTKFQPGTFTWAPRQVGTTREVWENYGTWVAKLISYDAETCQTGVNTGLMVRNLLFIKNSCIAYQPLAHL